MEKHSDGRHPVSKVPDDNLAPNPSKYKKKTGKMVGKLTNVLDKASWKKPRLGLSSGDCSSNPLGVKKK